jgi:cytochrome c oxidase subunit II
MAEVLTLVVSRDQYKHLFGIYVPIALGVFALVVVSMLTAVLVFRRRPIEEAAKWHEHNRLEGAYAVLLVCVIAFLLYLTFSTEHQVDLVSAQERPTLTIDVYGAKWEWQFSYPAYGINRYSGTVGHESLVVPTNEAIRFRLISRDVIHEFWVDELRYKHDLIPGSVQKATLVFGREGSFSGQCAEFCGLYHARMSFTVQALSPARFAAWASAQARATGASASAAPAAANAGRGAHS